jgi:hypothetical protein
MNDWISKLQDNVVLINSIIPELRSIGIDHNIVPDYPLLNFPFLFYLLSGNWKFLLIKILKKFHQVTDQNQKLKQEKLFVDVCKMLLEIPFPPPHGLKRDDLLYCFGQAGINHDFYNDYLDDIFGTVSRF